ncbi:hypothetical protein WJX74_003157 [Apatococcus lobatus]|uniref:hydroxyacylglutathione hydrolase n=1 Tax=Apatococcus lobatus TaxID=904363 RepID=A0AAW1S389_9CHLO
MELQVHSVAPCKVCRGACLGSTHALTAGSAVASPLHHAPNISKRLVGRHQQNTERRFSNFSQTRHRPLQSRCLATQAAAASLAFENSKVEVQRVPCLTDNYSWLLIEKASGKTAIVDPAEAQPVIAALHARDAKLDFILNTHHHWDHVGGNEELKAKYGAQIVGPKADEKRIPGIDVALSEGRTWKLGDLGMHVFDTPGHTRGHITLWFPDADVMFPGDTLFALGCGRLFEGTAPQMWQSLKKLLHIPAATHVCCGHEYTQSNAKFAAHFDPTNEALQARKSSIDSLRSQGLPTVPSTFGEELETNPFLRPHDAALRKAHGIAPDSSDEAAFAAIRKAKDSF